MAVAIQVSNVSKKYVIRHEEGRARYNTLRDTVAGKVQNIFKRSSRSATTSEEFWALRDLNFEINPGDRVGIVGRNGAGKSTLLKLLSRITEPTTGSIGIKGRVASLLEVGTGFHPELSGRENIFLNGAILGMNRSEIRSKFDDIVQFAEVEQFLDTPVKRYSSGMYVRLAFSVAAHLEPEILIVDEVLAVGDAQFQRKCLGKMEDISKGHGRVVLFVSHSMTSIQALCSKGIYLEKGLSNGIQPVADVVSRYLYGASGASTESEYDGSNGIDNPEARGQVRITKVVLKNSSGKMTSRFRTTEPVSIEIYWENLRGVSCTPNIQLKLATSQVTALIASDSKIDWTGEQKKQAGLYVSTFIIPPHLLNTNDFMLSVALDSHSPRVNYEYHLDILKISVWDPMDETSIARGMFTSVREDAVLWAALECSYNRIG